ncbi:hypothetical protein ALP29_200372 [Pseudomonas syringae pv. avii]|uniref:Uncharacterized protein n=1 Tax=Pseudomonas syringae pv. avii TaxID=663959 RepID=A0A3M5US95_PSESX|nr:hypothetical protein ALP29_200372 [Pseudomonas syringae pv. avii]
MAPLLDFQSMGCQRRAERALAMEFLLGVCRDRPAYECAGRSLNVLPRLCLTGEQIESSRLLSDKPGLQVLQMVI